MGALRAFAPAVLALLATACARHEPPGAPRKPASIATVASVTCGARAEGCLADAEVETRLRAHEDIIDTASLDADEARAGPTSILDPLQRRAPRRRARHLSAPRDSPAAHHRLYRDPLAQAAQAAEGLGRQRDDRRRLLSLLPVDPHVDVVLTGPASAAQLDENLRALERWPLSEEEQAWMRSFGRAVHG